MSIYDELFKISKEVNDAVAQQNKFVFVGATGFVIAMVLIYAYDLTLSNKYGTLTFLLALLGIFIAIWHSPKPLDIFHSAV